MGRATDEDRYCLYCGYSLRGLTMPCCPECGLGFDPKDEMTFGPRRWCLNRVWARPPSLWHILACLLAFSVFMFIRSTPGNPFYVLWFKDWVVFLIDGLLLLAGLCLCLDYVCRAAMTRTLRPRRASAAPHLHCRTRLLTWYVTPLCCLVVASSWVTNWPLAARFAISRPCLERFATDLVRRSPR